MSVYKNGLTIVKMINNNTTEDRTADFSFLINCMVGARGNKIELTLNNSKKKLINAPCPCYHLNCENETNLSARNG